MISGNHEAVAVIINYVEKEDVYYFTRKQPLETEAKLPLSLAKPIHNLVMSVSFLDIFIVNIVVDKLNKVIIHIHYNINYFNSDEYTPSQNCHDTKGIARASSKPFKGLPNSRIYVRQRVYKSSGCK